MYAERGPDLVIMCNACGHQARADYAAIVAAGRGDVPLRDLRFKCAKCGNKNTSATADGSRYGGRRPGEV